MEYIPLYLIFIPIISSMIIYLFNLRIINYLIFITQATISVLMIKYFLFINKNPQFASITIGGWDKRIGIELKNDVYSIAFIFLTIFIWTIVSIYCFDKRKNDAKFLFFLLFLEGAFLALLQTNDLFNLFVLIEIISIISTILIIFKKDGFAVRAGLYYLLFNSIGSIFYLLGMIIIYNIFGTLNIDVIKHHIHLIDNDLIIHAAFILMMSAIGVKSALFPVFTWLPKAHGAAPSSISALLSGLIVKSGLYVMIKVDHLFNLYTFKEYFFILGFFSAIIGILFALSQKDIKQILAYHTISQIGIILMGLSTINQITFYGGLYHIINHALFKSLLFLGAGMIIRTYNIRRVTEIRGVFKTMPLTSIFIIVGMLSITGAPFFNGFISKSLIVHGLKEQTFIYFLFFIINIGTATSFIKFSQIFFGKSKLKGQATINEKIALFILSIACITLGLHFNYFNQYLFHVESPVVILDLYNIMTYFITIIIGFILYQTIIKKDYLVFKKIRHMHITFETTNYLLVLYIFTMILWSFKAL